jgi:uncharacterized protein (DUF2236 family)
MPMGTSEERQICRREVSRSHAGVRSTAGSPVSYSAFDPRLQLWVAACLYRGVIDIHTLLHGPVDDATAEAIYRESWRLGTTLQHRVRPAQPVPDHRVPSPPFREHMQLAWTESEQRQFGFLMRMIASVNRLLPPPVSRFPFNACLQDLRVRIMWNRRCSGAALRPARPGIVRITEVPGRAGYGEQDLRVAVSRQGKLSRDAGFDDRSFRMSARGQGEP